MTSSTEDGRAEVTDATTEAPVPQRRVTRATAVLLVLCAFVAALLASMLPAGAWAQEAQESDQAVQQQGQPLVTAYYLNVGQGDSEFVVLPDGSNVLIDAGPSDAGDAIVSWLRGMGVTRIDHVVATHPHADHIGGMVKVLTSFQIGDVWMPQNADANTKTYLNLLQTLSQLGVPVYDACAGETVASGDGFTMQVVSPQAGETFKDLNDYSAELLLTYGERTFLFTGDASAYLTQRAVPGHVDVLKVAHHGSDTGSTAALMSQLTPQVAVIECSADNSYGHPTQETLDELAAVGAQVYATFANGIVTVTSDGSTVTATCETPGPVTSQQNRAAASTAGASATVAATAATTVAPADPAAEAPAPDPAPAAESPDGGDATVYITKTGKKYHADGCRSLRKSKIPISKSDAIAQGYTPCEICNP